MCNIVRIRSASVTFLLSNMDFSEILKEIKQYKTVSRKGWNGSNLFVIKQIPSRIPEEVIQGLSSLPESAKRILITAEHQAIYYDNQMIIVNNSTGAINSWVPSSSDIFAEDWFVIS